MSIKLIFQADIYLNPSTLGPKCDTADLSCTHDNIILDMFYFCKLYIISKQCELSKLGFAWLQPWLSATHMSSFFPTSDKRWTQSVLRRRHEESAVSPLVKLCSDFILKGTFTSPDAATEARLFSMCCQQIQCDIAGFEQWTNFQHSARAFDWALLLVITTSSEYFRI